MQKYAEKQENRKDKKMLTNDENTAFSMVLAT